MYLLESKMRWSRYFLQTVREVPGDAEAVSHVLLTRSVGARGPHPPASRALGEERALGALRRRGDPLPPEGPQGRGILPGADGRRGHDRAARVRRAFLPAASRRPLPGPDQVPRRDPPAVRPHARPRVPDV